MMSEDPIARCYTCRHQHVSLAEQPCRDCPTRLRLSGSQWEPKPAPPPAEEAKPKLSDQMVVGSVWDSNATDSNPWTVIVRLPEYDRIVFCDSDRDIRLCRISLLDTIGFGWILISPAPTPKPRTLSDLGIKPGTRFEWQGARWTLVNLGVRQDGHDDLDIKVDSFFDEAIILPDATDAHCGRQPKPEEMPGTCE